MSLDICLEIDKELDVLTGPTVPVRVNGRTAMVYKGDWTGANPGREPVEIQVPEKTNVVYWGNITHNLNKMAAEAGIYQHLWRPWELDITHARQLIDPLRSSLICLGDDPEHFKEFNPPNGWGNYDILVDFLAELLSACVDNPDAKVRVSV